MLPRLPGDIQGSYPAQARIIRRPFLINVCLSAARPPNSETGDLGETEVRPGAITPEYQFEKDQRAHAVGDKDVFVGIAGFRSLDFLSMVGKDTDPKKQYKHAVLFDVNERQIRAMQKVMGIIKESDTPEQFCRRFSEIYDTYMRPPGPGEPNYDAFHKMTPAEQMEFYSAFGCGYQPQTGEQLMKYFERAVNSTEHSWLHPENYAYIRQLVLHKDIEMAIIDLRDTTRMQSLSAWVRGNGLHIGHMYLSSATDFVDPNLKTDYYSRSRDQEGAALQQARDFYKNILNLTNKKTRFIISVPSTSAEILHSYHLKHVGQDYIRQQRDALPENEPSLDERSYSILFQAGGQVWRFASFGKQGGRYPRGHQYFRIFSQNFPEDRHVLEQQIGIINGILAGNSSVDHSSLESLMKRWQEPDDIPTDFKFFDHQRQSQSNRYVCLSSDAFQMDWRADHTSIETLIESVKKALNEIKGTTPEIRTKPAAAVAFLAKRAPTSPSSTSPQIEGR